MGPVDKSSAEGRSSYFVLGNDQADWKTRSTAPIQKIYSFRSNDITPTFDLYEDQRNTGFAGRTKPEQGLLGVEGSIEIPLTETHLGAILKWIMGNTPGIDAASRRLCNWRKRVSRIRDGQHRANASNGQTTERFGGIARRDWQDKCDPDQCDRRGQY